MTNQKELSVMQIKLMFQDTQVLKGKTFNPTTEQIQSLMTDEGIKALIYENYELYEVRKKLSNELSRARGNNLVNSL